MVAPFVIPAASTQLLLCIAADWDSPAGELQCFTRNADGGWQPASAPLPVMLGRKGLAWGRGLHPLMAGTAKQEGDGRAPAGVFVLPSRHDGWGVVVNEACAAGLPVISTSAVGSARDLLVDGSNGFVLARDDVAGLAEKMSFFAANPDQIRVFGDRSRERAAAFSVEHGAALFCDNAHAAAQKS